MQAPYYCGQCRRGYNAPGDCLCERDDSENCKYSTYALKRQLIDQAETVRLQKVNIQSLRKKNETLKKLLQELLGN